eukprot:gene234-438_t
MKTTNASAEHKTSGGLAISPEACLTMPGYGYSGRKAELCPAGTWNDGGNRDSCQECADGFTTVASGSTSASACNVSTGSTGLDCPDVCAPGYGGSDCSPCGSGYFSPGYSTDVCQACPASSTFVFQGSGVTDSTMVFDSPSVSGNTTASVHGCVAQYAQLTGASAGPLSASSGMTAPSGVTTLEACAAACTAADRCQFLVFDYLNSTAPCWIRTAGPATAANNQKRYTLAFKQVAAGMAEAGSSLQLLKSIGSGSFTVWVDSTAQDVAGFQAVAAATSAADCMDLCTEDVTCYAARIQSSSAGVFELCGLINPVAADTDWGSKRTLIKAVPQLNEANAAPADGGSAGSGSAA